MDIEFPPKNRFNYCRVLIGSNHLLLEAHSKQETTREMVWDKVLLKNFPINYDVQFPKEFGPCSPWR